MSNFSESIFLIGRPFIIYQSYVKKLVKNSFNALARVSQYINLSKRKILMNTFFDSQFKYGLLIWMCHSRINNRKIDRLLERYLMIIYKDIQSWFKELLEKNSSIFIHERNVQMLLLKVTRPEITFHIPIWTKFLKWGTNIPAI